MIRSMRAAMAAPAHITQGSKVAEVAPSRRHEPTAAAASRSAMISACPVGSLLLPHVASPTDDHVVGADHDGTHGHIVRSARPSIELKCLPDPCGVPLRGGGVVTGVSESLATR